MTKGKHSLQAQFNMRNIDKQKQPIAIGQVWLGLKTYSEHKHIQLHIYQTLEHSTVWKDIIR